MFFDLGADDQSKLRAFAADPLKALIAPRPIGWIGSRSAQHGDNLAPYSFFNMVCDAPPCVMFASSGQKDSVTNVELSGEFSCSMVSLPLAGAMNQSSKTCPPSTDEFALAGLEKAECKLINAPYVAQALAHLECKVQQVIELESTNAGRQNKLVLGKVVGFRVSDTVISGEQIDAQALALVARCGGANYSVADRLFQMQRPG